MGNSVSFRTLMPAPIAHTGLWVTTTRVLNVPRSSRGLNTQHSTLNKVRSTGRGALQELIVVYSLARLHTTISSAVAKETGLQLAEQASASPPR
jgi:hypothetical protein